MDGYIIAPAFAGAELAKNSDGTASPAVLQVMSYLLAGQQPAHDRISNKAGPGAAGPRGRGLKAGPPPRVGILKAGPWLGPRAAAPRLLRARQHMT